MRNRYSSLAGRSIVITGAGRGFGRLMALALLHSGANVLGTAARNGGELAKTAALAGGEATADAAEAFSLAAGQSACGVASVRGRFIGIIADVSDYAACERTVARALQEFGRVDVLINNAARGPLEANDNYFLAKPKFWEAKPDAWQTMIETNLIGAFFMARAIAPQLIANKFGRIINISTSLPTMVMPGLAAYGASKGGLEVASILWARDLADSGVTVNVLLPGGPADTALIPGGVVGMRAKADFRQGKGARGDEGRVGGILPAEVMIAPTLWLCADESSGYTGRRLIAKDWDPDLDAADAAVGCMQPQHAAPRIM